MSQNIARFIVELDIDEEKWLATCLICGERWETQDGETETDFLDSSDISHWNVWDVIDAVD